MNYLDFEYSEDGHGGGTFDAMASTRASLVEAVRAEVAEVLDWAYAEFGPCGASDEGGEWDYDLQGAQEYSVPQQIGYDVAMRVFSVQSGAGSPPRHTLSLSISGSPGFCAAFRERFVPDM